MKFLSLLILLFVSNQMNCQNQIKNTHSSWHEMHGGMEESGIDRTESFIFVASKKITLKQIFYENKEIELKAKDSLQVNRSSHRAYSIKNTNAPNFEEEKGKIPVEKRFRVWKKNN